MHALYIYKYTCYIYIYNLENLVPSSISPSFRFCLNPWPWGELRPRSAAPHLGVSFAVCTRGRLLGGLMSEIGLW